MSKTGIATLPLHYGSAPTWLFERMTLLSREIVYALVMEFGQDAFLKKLSDPFWFQAFGCVLGFDWHSSGLTTTVTGAMKEGLRGLERDVGVFIAGGKGKTARKTPEQIRNYVERYLMLDPDKLVYASRISAKIDNSAIQDGYQIYHHVFIFTEKGKWAVIQQGMNKDNKTARRYHWLSDNVNDFVIEPHTAICCDKKGVALNLIAKESGEARQMCTLLSRETPEKIVKEFKTIQRLDLTRRHKITIEDINPKKLYSILTKTYEIQPSNFEELLRVEGVGPKSLRALSLVSELIYGVSVSYKDPARFSFAHGGKDGTPFPVDRRIYDKTIEVMKKAVHSASIGNREKLKAIERLSKIEDKLQ
jgi:hypothetical protein